MASKKETAIAKAKREDDLLIQLNKLDKDNKVLKAAVNRIEILMAHLNDIDKKLDTIIKQNNVINKLKSKPKED